HYPTVMAVPCMYNSAYAAPFEDLDCFEAFGECLALAGEDLDPAAAGLLRAFRAHALERGAFYYPTSCRPKSSPAPRKAARSTARCRSRWRTSIPTARRPGASGRKSTAAAWRWPSPPTHAAGTAPATERAPG